MTNKPATPPRKTQKDAEAAPVVAKTVTVRITKMGADKVSAGVHHAHLGDELYSAGEIIELPEPVAIELEQRGFAEIQ